MQQMNGKNPLHRKGIISRRNSVFYARNFLVHPAKKRPAPPKEQNLFNEAEKEQYPAAAEAEEIAASLPEKKQKGEKPGLPM